ncbi:MAG TPA: M28 family metallopeptidase [Chiayiivirga sp.]|nr:M28 family metallopeptidase [Chiayiivirga sp.]
MRFPLLPAVLACALLAGCQRSEPAAPVSAPAPAPAADSVPAAPDKHVFEAAISAEDFRADITTLASDEFGGRAPGTQGETLTVEYLRDRFAAMGLQPGNGDRWFQTVPMVETTATPVAAAVKIRDKSVEWTFGSQWVAGTRTGEASVQVTDSPMVFVGYGTVAPEENWNDYAGLDLKGKTVVMLVNDPGFHVDDPALFGGKRMTYYGRWTYKFEEAARQGATAALIIHDTAGAGYGWSVVENSWSGAQYDLPAGEDPEPRLPLQGWITGEAAQDLFAQSGLSLEALRLAANKPGFKAVPLPASLTVTLQSAVKTSESRNVLALLPGSERPEEAVVYMAHWDHLGTHVAADGSVQIFNGAIDNASGVAGILEIAEAFARSGQAPKRSVLFAAVTLEESGLLGSKHYVAHPTFPMRNIAGVINIDAMSIIGRTRDIVVTGYGASELEDLLRPIAERQGRVLHGEGSVEKGFYFRSDHFNFAKAGVPALYASSGLDHVEKGEEYGLSIAQEYGANRYHKPGDVVDPGWDLSGVVQDLEALYAVGRELADGAAWPNWYPGNPFRAVRDADRAKAEN